jgi:hypothetical protein
LLLKSKAFDEKKASKLLKKMRFNMRAKRGDQILCWSKGNEKFSLCQIDLNNIQGTTKDSRNHKKTHQEK